MPRILAQQVPVSHVAYLLVRSPQLNVLNVAIFIGHRVPVLQRVKRSDHPSVEG